MNATWISDRMQKQNGSVQKNTEYTQQMLDGAYQAYKDLVNTFVKRRQEFEASKDDSNPYVHVFRHHCLHSLESSLLKAEEYVAEKILFAKAHHWDEETQECLVKLPHKKWKRTRRFLWNLRDDTEKKNHTE